MSHDRIAVVDFGGQYAHLIATKVRSVRVLAEIRQPDDPVEAFAGFQGIRSALFGCWPRFANPMTP